MSRRREGEGLYARHLPPRLSRFRIYDLYHSFIKNLRIREKGSQILDKETILYLLFFVFRKVFNSGIAQCLLALHAGAAFAAVLVSALVARPRLRVVDVQLLTPSGNVALRYAGVWRNHSHSVVRPRRCGAAHCRAVLAGGVLVLLRHGDGLCGADPGVPFLLRA